MGTTTTEEFCNDDPNLVNAFEASIMALDPSSVCVSKLSSDAFCGDNAVVDLWENDILEVYPDADCQKQ